MAMQTKKNKKINHTYTTQKEKACSTISYHNERCRNKAYIGSIEIKKKSNAIERLDHDYTPVI